MRIASKAAERADSAALIQLFCQATREFFQVSGVYFWRRHPGDELIGEQADGKMAASFPGMRLLSRQSAVTADAVHTRRTIFVNRVQSVNFPLAQQFEARSLMAAPLVVFNEVIGAATFLHDSEEVFFDDSGAAAFQHRDAAVADGIAPQGTGRRVSGRQSRFPTQPRD